MNAVANAIPSSSKQYDGFGILSKSERTKYWGVSPVSNKKNEDRWTVRFKDRVSKEIIKFKVANGPLSEQEAASIATMFYKDPELYSNSCEPIVFRAVFGSRFTINTCSNVITKLEGQEVLASPVTNRQDPRRSVVPFQKVTVKTSTAKAKPAKAVEESPFAAIMAEVKKISRRINKLKKALGQ